jgi:hypothetical protein
MAEHHEKVKVLKEKLSSINQEASDIKGQLKKAKKDLFAQNFQNSKQNVASLLDIHISLRSLMVFFVVIGVLVGLVFFIKYLSGISIKIDKEDSGALQTIEKSLEEAEELKDAVAVDAADESDGDPGSDSENDDDVLDLGEIVAENITLVAENPDKESIDDTEVASSNDLPVAEQELITSYSKISMAFSGKGIIVEPKTGFSKVKKILYKVVNNANGRIQVDSISYVYASDPKVVVDVSLDEGQIGAGVTKELVLDPANVPKKTHLGTFTDSEDTIKYSLTLRDDSGEIIATVTKEFDVN